MPATLIAACLVFAVVGIAHSVLGEVLIFRHLRRNGIVPILDAPPLRGRHIRILWATWHIASVFGGALAVILWRVATAPGTQATATCIQSTIAIAALVSATLVFVATRARHPGWIGLLAVAALLLIHLIRPSS